jgi:chromosome segregation ATPase
MSLMRILPPRKTFVAIEKCSDTAAASTQKKYDARAICDKIAVERRQLSELETENAALVETAKHQERALRQLSHGDDDAAEAPRKVAKLRRELAAAQKEMKTFEERRHGLLVENGQLEATEKGSAGVTDRGEANEGELSARLEQVEKRQEELEARKRKEQAAYEKKMQGLEEQKERKKERKKERQRQEKAEGSAGGT